MLAERRKPPGFPTLIPDGSRRAATKEAALGASRRYCGQSACPGEGKSRKNWFPHQESQRGAAATKVERISIRSNRSEFRSTKCSQENKKSGNRNSWCWTSRNARFPPRHDRIPTGAAWAVELPKPGTRPRSARRTGRPWQTASPAAPATRRSLRRLLSRPHPHQGVLQDRKLVGVVAQLVQQAIDQGLVDPRAEQPGRTADDLGQLAARQARGEELAVVDGFGPRSRIKSAATLTVFTQDFQHSPVSGR